MSKSLFEMKRCTFCFFFIVTAVLLTSVNAFSVNYYLSSGGDDSNTGTSPGQAWKTLERLNKLVPRPGDSILFRRGDAWNGTVTVNMWGFEGRPLVYGAYGTGSRPKIYGSEQITTWEKYSGNIYKARFPKAINQLFVGDQKMRVARFPNKGYATISAVRGSKRFSSGEIPSDWDVTGAVWFGRTGYYHTVTRSVISAAKGTLTLEEAPENELNVGEGFILMNKLAFLDEPGEWCYDAATRTVYLWLPGSTSPEKQVVRGSVHDYGFYSRGKSHIEIRDLELAQQASTGIETGDGDDWKIEGNVFHYPERYAINDESKSNHHLIANNILMGANHLAIQLRTNHTTLTGNKILDTGLFDNLGITGNGRFYFGSAVFIGGEKNVVSYNRIIDASYNGIFFAGPGNLIEYNFIENTCLVKGDGGGIYTTQPGSNPTTGSVIRYNIVINTVGSKEGFTSKVSFGEGIYIDESAHGVTVEHNTIYKTSNAGIKLHKTDGNIIRYNTIMDARYGIQVLLASGSTPARITHNIMYATSNGCVDNYEPRQLLVRISSPNAVVDKNIYRNPYQRKGIFRGEEYCSFDEWKSQTGYDSNSSFIGTKLKRGETEKLFYNDTRHTKTFRLGPATCRDIYGNPVSGSFTLEPFTSKILIGSDFPLRAGK